MLSAFLVGLVSMAVLFVATTFAVDADWGPPLGVALLVLAAIVAAIGIVSVIAGFARSTEQATAQRLDALAQDELHLSSRLVHAGAGRSSVG